MAFPVFRSAGTPVLSDGMTITSPSDVVVGDLLLFFCWSQGTTIPTHTLQTGFTEVRTHAHNDGTTDGRLSLASKVATAAGAQTYTPYTTNGVAGQNNIGMIVIRGESWDGSLSGWAQNSVTATGTGVPNPGSVTGLTGDFLVVVGLAWQITSAGSTTATPGANYTESTEGPAGSHVTHLQIEHRGLNGLVGATEDPAAGTDNVTPNGSASITVAVPVRGTDFPANSHIQTNASIPVRLALGAAVLAGALAGTGYQQRENANVNNTPAAVVITGDASITLAALTTTASGVVAQGSEIPWPQLGNSPPPGIYVSAQARVAAAIAIARNQQRIQEQAASHDAYGTLAVTLGALTLTGAGDIPSLGTFSVTLGALTLSGDGVVAQGSEFPWFALSNAPPPGALEVQARILAAPRSGAPEVLSPPPAGVSGDASITLAALTLSGAAAVDVQGTATPTLGTLTLSGAGAVEIKGTATPTLGALTLSGDADVIAGGALTTTLGALTLSGDADVIAGGSATPTLGALTLSAAGTVVNPNTSTGTLNVTLANAYAATGGSNVLRIVSPAINPGPAGVTLVRE